MNVAKTKKDEFGNPHIPPLQAPAQRRDSYTPSQPQQHGALPNRAQMAALCGPLRPATA